MQWFDGGATGTALRTGGEPPAHTSASNSRSRPRRSI